MILTEPNNGAATLTEYFKFLKSIRTPIIRSIHLDIFIRQVLHDGPLQIEFIFRQYNIVVCIIIDISISIVIILAIVHLLSLLLSCTTSCIVTLPLKVLPRNDIVIVVVFAHLLTLPLLVMLLRRVLVRVLRCRAGLATEAWIHLYLSFKSIHMQTVIHITLVFLPRLPSRVFRLLRALVLLFYLLLGCHLLHVLFVERALLRLEMPCATLRLIIKIVFTLLHGRMRNGSRWNRLLQNLTACASN